nr:NADH dehydrogenase subunit 6 [Marcia japonica]UYR95106.1 NADH dehydrogenase subunit 6 [Marcia japonica]
MLEFLFCFSFLGFMHVLSRYNHPMFFGFGLLGVMVVLSTIFSFYSGVYGFATFMCVVSGVLVVFAYSVALVPLELSKNDKKLMNTEKQMTKPWQSSKGEELKASWVMTGCSVLFCMLGVMGLSFLNSKINLTWFQSILYVSHDWSIGMVVFGLLLFLVMIFCVSVAGKYKGALIK